MVAPSKGVSTVAADASVRLVPSGSIRVPGWTRISPMLLLPIAVWFGVIIISVSPAPQLPDGGITPSIPGSPSAPSAPSAPGAPDAPPTIAAKATGTTTPVGSCVTVTLGVGEPFATTVIVVVSPVVPCVVIVMLALAMLSDPRTVCVAISEVSRWNRTTISWGVEGLQVPDTESCTHTICPLAKPDTPTPPEVTVGTKEVTSQSAVTFGSSSP